MTKAQRAALEAVEDGQVLVDGLGQLVYDGKAVHGNSLATCRKRGWTETGVGCVILTYADRRALAAARS